MIRNMLIDCRVNHHSNEYVPIHARRYWAAIDLNQYCVFAPEMLPGKVHYSIQ